MIPFRGHLHRHGARPDAGPHADAAAALTQVLGGIHTARRVMGHRCNVQEHRPSTQGAGELTQGCGADVRTRGADARRRGRVSVARLAYESEAGEVTPLVTLWSPVG